MNFNKYLQFLLDIGIRQFLGVVKVFRAMKLASHNISIKIAWKASIFLLPYTLYLYYSLTFSSGS